MARSSGRTPKIWWTGFATTTRRMNNCLSVPKWSLATCDHGCLRQLRSTRKTSTQSCRTSTLTLCQVSTNNRARCQRKEGDLSKPIQRESIIHARSEHTTQPETPGTTIQKYL